VLVHLSRNADGLRNLLLSARTGEPLRMYPGPDGGDLASDGLAGDHDRALGRAEHERRARVDLENAYAGQLVPSRLGRVLNPNKLQPPGPGGR
jgi:hypothetical protein